MNERLGIGGNYPPSPITAAASSLADLAVYMQDNPVVVTDEDARLAKTHIDRAKASLEELEIARKLEVKPYNDKVSSINTEYKAAYHPLERMMRALKDRLSDFIRVEQKRREQEASEHRASMAKAELAARE